MLDSSTSVSSSNFQQLLRMIVRIVDQFEIGSAATQVGLISYSGTPSTSLPFGFSLGTFAEKEQLKQAILSLQQMSVSARRTDLALSTARQQLLSSRTNVPNAVIVITSGLSDDPQLTVMASALLQLVRDIEVSVIGTSAAVDSTAEFLEEAYAIGQDPDSDHVFMIHGFQDQSINFVSDSLTKELCDGKKLIILIIIIMVVISHYFSPDFPQMIAMSGLIPSSQFLFQSLNIIRISVMRFMGWQKNTLTLFQIGV